jgi:hypothetical protein
MTSFRRGVAAVLFLVTLTAASRARAQDVEPVESPSPALLGAGIAVAVGGAALSYWTARKFEDNQGSYGWLLLNSTGGLVMQIGGAIETVWGWQLGESKLSYEVRGNLPLRSRRPLALGAFAVGAAAVVAMYVGIGIVFAKEVSCLDKPNTPDDISRCIGDTIMTSTIINLAAGGVLLVAAPIVGYGFGYDSAAEGAGRPLSMRLVPTVVAGGSGLALVGRF